MGFQKAVGAFMFSHYKLNKTMFIHFCEAIFPRKLRKMFSSCE